MRWSILTLFALIACQDKKLAPPDPLAAPTPPRDGVVLLLPGTGPLQPIRYQVSPETVWRSELVYDLEIKTDGQPSPLPLLVIDLETRVDSKRADGTAKLRIAVLRTTVRERTGATASELVRREAEAMQGVVITELLAPDGAVSDIRIEAPGALTEAARAQLDNLLRSLDHAVPRLPTEAVGAGASWRERKTLPEGGIRAVTETIYLLTSRVGDTITYTSTAASAAKPQKVVQDGTLVDVTDTHGHAASAGTVDLSRRAFELTASSWFSTTMNVVAPPGTPGAGRSTIEVAIKLQVSRAPAGHDPGAPGSNVGPAAEGGSAQGAHNAP
jgi:hypothetical protein